MPHPLHCLALTHLRQSYSHYDMQCSLLATVLICLCVQAGPPESLKAVDPSLSPLPRPPHAEARGLGTGLRDASRSISTLSHEVDWPWSGSVRNHVYKDFAAYIMLLVVFCCITLWATTKRSSDAFNLVQSIQSTLVKEVTPVYCCCPDFVHLGDFLLLARSCAGTHRRCACR
jgi:hypothetical protein